jgi:hypothetical protein
MEQIKLNRGKIHLPRKVSSFFFVYNGFTMDLQWIEICKLLLAIMLLEINCHKNSKKCYTKVINFHVCHCCRHLQTYSQQKKMETQTTVTHNLH